MPTASTLPTRPARAAPQRAQPPRLSPDQTLTQAAACVLQEMWEHFATNLTLLSRSDDPEVLHQARVGWRRFKSALRLFKPLLSADSRPVLLPLQGLLTLLGELRELDVASTDTLPPLESAYTAGHPHRANDWRVMTQALAQATTHKRQAVRRALKNPRLRTALLDISEWLETLGTEGAAVVKASKAKLRLRPWARKRIARLHEQLKLNLSAPASADQQHQTRIAAKRLRYGIEALRPLLPKQRARRWTERALRLQTQLGAARDLVQAGELVSQLPVDAGLVAFLQGVAVGQGALAGPTPGLLRS